MGLRYLADPDRQIPILNAVATYEGVEEAALRKKLLTQYGIEIGGGLGAVKANRGVLACRGESATPRHVETVLEALKEIL